MWRINGNYWHKQKYSYDEAVELSKTLKNCNDCEGCLNCKFCKFCESCSECDTCKYCRYCENHTDCKKIDGRENDE